MDAFEAGVVDGMVKTAAKKPGRVTGWMLKHPLATLGLTQIPFWVSQGLKTRLGKSMALTAKNVASGAVRKVRR